MNFEWPFARTSAPVCYAFASDNGLLRIYVALALLQPPVCQTTRLKLPPQECARNRIRLSLYVAHLVELSYNTCCRVVPTLGPNILGGVRFSFFFFLFCYRYPAEPARVVTCKHDRSTYDGDLLSRKRPYLHHSLVGKHATPISCGVLGSCSAVTRICGRGRVGDVETNAKRVRRHERLPPLRSNEKRSGASGVLQRALVSVPLSLPFSRVHLTL